MASHQRGDLEQLRALPLEAKVRLTKARIQQWLDHYDGMAYVSFSGGKDSTVLAHLVHQVDPTVPLVFSNTGLEHASIQSFARKMGAEFIRPEMRFDDVIRTYGYPIISKEVSEAIYYARRIRNGSTQRERERTPERKRTELQGNREKTERLQRGENSRDTEAISFGQSEYQTSSIKERRQFRTSQPGYMVDRTGAKQNSVRSCLLGTYDVPPFSSSTGENDADRISAEDVSAEGSYLYDSKGTWQGNRRTILIGNYPMESSPPQSTEWKDWRRGCL